MDMVVIRHNGYCARAIIPLAVVKCSDCWVEKPKGSLNADPSARGKTLPKAAGILAMADDRSEHTLYLIYAATLFYPPKTPIDDLLSVDGLLSSSAGLVTGGC
jgi:hypothetical protein